MCPCKRNIGGIPFRLSRMVFIKVESRNPGIARRVERPVESGASKKRSKLENASCGHNPGCANRQKCFQQGQSTCAPACGDWDVGDPLRWWGFDRSEELERADMVHYRLVYQFGTSLPDGGGAAAAAASAWAG